ncbi:DUF4114 domain-containing protein [Ideonella sp.]|uniref:DUF4114 domain-containing protein n=1 Tax=Ideonella sp. TaxID=1929293 RepID=UPI003BB6D8DF
MTGRSVWGWKALGVAMLMTGVAAQAQTVGALQDASQNGSGWAGQYVSPQLTIAAPAGAPGANEWFSRYASGNGDARFNIDAALLSQFKTAPLQDSVGIGLVADDTSVRVTYLGTGAARDSNLFLAYAGSGSFSSSAFWNPVYDSGGTNNLGLYNPVSATNQLIQTRAGCSYATAKAGNTCEVEQLGRSREISGLTVGDNLVFGLQALPLVYNADRINLPNTNYFFSGAASNNQDSRSWNDGLMHTKMLNLGGGSFLVGFEDTWGGGDRDFNDNLFLFEGVTSNVPLPAVPEPGTWAMMLAGLAMLARRGSGLSLWQKHYRKMNN